MNIPEHRRLNVALACCCAVLLAICATMFWNYGWLKIRVAWASEQTEIFEEMRTRAIGSDLAGAAGCLQYAYQYYPSGSKQQAAWREVPYPGDDHIFTPDSYDDEDITDYFRGTTWRGHDPVKLRAHSSAFTFFTPEAYHYWLPAFIMAAIENPAEADVVVDRISSSVFDSYAPRRWSLFTDAQRIAVAAYLRFQIVGFGGGNEDEREGLRALGQVA